MADRLPIPEFDAEGNLPPGDHFATLDEIAARFVFPRRQKRYELTQTLVKFVQFVISYRPIRIFIDGSYVTEKQLPSDVDIGIVFPESFDLAGESWRFQGKSDLTKSLDVELFKIDTDSKRLENMLNGWKIDLDTQRPKGIVYVELPYDQE